MSGGPAVGPKEGLLLCGGGAKTAIGCASSAVTGGEVYRGWPSGGRLKPWICWGAPCMDMPVAGGGGMEPKGTPCSLAAAAARPVPIPAFGGGGVFSRC